MKQKIYFAGSIRGGRKDVTLYQEIINYIKQTDLVLTEHIGNLSQSTTMKTKEDDIQIYQTDMAMLKNCDLVIAECTNPSLGVGYELAYAEKIQKPVYIFYPQSETQLSAMLNGNSYFKIIPYETRDDLFKQLDCILKGEYI